MTDEQWEEMQAEEIREQEAIISSQERARKKAEASYSPGEEMKYCPDCGMPLVAGSANFHAGFHADGCY